MSFREVASIMFRGTGAILVAIHDGTQLQVCPQKTDRNPLYSGQICVAIARDQECLAPYTRKGSSDGRRAKLMAIREKQLQRTHLEGPHVSAIKLLGNKLSDRLLENVND